MPDTTTTPPSTDTPKKPSIVDRFKGMPLGGKIVGGLGVAALAILGAPALLPVALVSAGTAVYYRRKSGCMTPERQAIYEALLRNMKDAKKLREMADVFDKEGCKKEAVHLRLRANLRDMPASVRKDRRDAYEKAIGVTDPKKVPEILALADEFQKLGADGAAADLRTYAATLKQAA